jgi:hypothetical protein
MSHFKDAQIAFLEAMKFIRTKNWGVAKAHLNACIEFLKKCEEDKDTHKDYSPADFFRMNIEAKWYMGTVCSELNLWPEANKWVNEGALVSRTPQEDFVFGEIYLSIANSDTANLFSAFSLKKAMLDCALRVFVSLSLRETEVVKKKLLIYKVFDVAILAGENEIIANNSLWVINSMPSFISMLESITRKEVQDYNLYKKAYNILARSFMKLGLLRTAQIFQLAERCFSSIVSSNDLQTILNEFKNFHGAGLESIRSEDDRLVIVNLPKLLRTLQMECDNDNFPNIGLKNFIRSDEGKALFSALFSKIAEIAHQYMVQLVQTGVDVPSGNLRQMVLDVNAQNNMLSNQLQASQRATTELAGVCRMREDELRELRKDNERLKREVAALKEEEEERSSRSRKVPRRTVSQMTFHTINNNVAVRLPPVSSLDISSQSRHVLPKVFLPPIILPPLHSTGSAFSSIRQSNNVGGAATVTQGNELPKPQ